jgi:hypothetical protein
MYSFYNLYSICLLSRFVGRICIMSVRRFAENRKCLNEFLEFILHSKHCTLLLKNFILYFSSFSNFHLFFFSFPSLTCLIYTLRTSRGGRV